MIPISTGVSIKSVIYKLCPLLQILRSLALTQRQSEESNSAVQKCKETVNGAGILSLSHMLAWCICTSVVLAMRHIMPNHIYTYYFIEHVKICMQVSNEQQTPTRIYSF